MRAFLVTHIIEGFFVPVDGLARDADLLGDLGLVHARDGVDVFGSGISAESVFFECFGDVHNRVFLGIAVFYLKSPLSIFRFFR